MLRTVITHVCFLKQQSQSLLSAHVLLFPPADRLNFFSYCYCIYYLYLWLEDHYKTHLSRLWLLSCTPRSLQSKDRRNRQVLVELMEPLKASLAFNIIMMEFADWSNAETTGLLSITANLQPVMEIYKKKEGWKLCRCHWECLPSHLPSQGPLSSGTAGNNTVHSSMLNPKLI